MPEPTPGVCPSECDADCEAGCHEHHAVPWKRHHDPKTCPGNRSTGSWSAAGARIQARWGHGHDQLTDGCALCQAEYAEARAWAQANPEEAPDARM